jgi:hypothetical protein
MPYYIYRIFAFPVRRLEAAGCEDAFRDASTGAKLLRADPALPEGCVVKLVFANNELEAEDRLNEVRVPVPGVVGDE